MRAVAAITAGAAGVLCAVLLTFPAAAFAWDWQSLPSGYNVSSYQTICHVATDPCVNGEGSTCNHVTINGTFAETDCVNPTFQDDVDRYVNSTICTVNPSAGQAQGMCLPPATSTAAPPGATTTDQVTTTAPIVTVPETTPVTTTVAPPVTTAPPGTVTVTVETVLVDPTIDQRLSLLEQRQSVDEARITALENPTGAIIGEPKNVAPFIDPV